MILLSTFPILCENCLAQQDRWEIIDKEYVKHTVTRGAEIFKNNYTYREKGMAVYQLLMKRLKAGKYNGIINIHQLADKLTNDIHSVCSDKHAGFRVIYPVSPGEKKPQIQQDPTRTVKGFFKVEILPGNIGYIQLNAFSHRDAASKLAAGIIEFVSNTDAVIFDLRNNGGGASPEYLLGFLFDKPTQVSKSISRDNNAETVEHVYTEKITPIYVRETANAQGAIQKDTLVSDVDKVKDKEVYVLTSRRTFSAGEAFAYSIQAFKKGKVIGERTRGGAHPVQVDRLNQRMLIRVPYGRSENVVTKTDWEGVGVKPDFQTEALNALTLAHEIALKTIRERAADTVAKKLVDWDIETFKASQFPVEIQPDQNKSYVGKYGPHEIVSKNKKLYDVHRGYPIQLIYLGNDQFIFDEHTRLKFLRNSAGNITSLLIVDKGGNNREFVKE